MALNDPGLLDAFANGVRLPPGFGVGLDERVVEFPWLFAQGLRGRTLDAGSALNHEHIVDRALQEVDQLHIVTLEPEEFAFTARRVSYVYADLRDLPYRDGCFDTVVCLSTLEHVGMENERYGVQEAPAADPGREMLRAVAELRRVGAGQLLVSVPYGRREDHGWFRQFDHADVDALQDAAGGRSSVSVFEYSFDGWQVSDLESAAQATYRDYTADPTPVDDLAAAARAVACLRFELEP